MGEVAPGSRKNWLPWLGAALAGAGGAAYWAHYKRPLPKYKGTLSLPELERPVQISRDAMGIPTIDAENWADAWRGLGFVHGQDRLFQMDLNRRAASGRLSEIFGAQTLRADRFLRRLSLVSAASAEWDIADVQERLMLDGYSQGVNASIAQQGLSSEFQILGTRPLAWTGKDSLLWVKALANDLGCNWEAELMRGRLLSHLGDEGKLESAAAWSLVPPADLPCTLGGLTSDLFKQLVDEYAAVREALPDGFGPSAPLGGSNCWAVAGFRSVDGLPILANDPHLIMKVPDYWYQVRIRLPGQELFGATMPGLPGIILGQNGYLSWGVTNAYIDTHDLFVERRLDDGRVQGPKGPEPLLRRTDTIRVHKSEAHLEEIFATKRGPLLGPWDANGLGLSLAWSARTPGHFFRALSGLNRAHSVDEATEALRDWHLPVLNFVLADKKDIAHHVAGRIPIRRPFSGLVPVPAWEEAWAWQGTREFDELPAQKNPECGYIVSANHVIGGPDYPHFLSWDFNPGLRAERIESLLLAREKHDLDSFRGIQLDEGTTLGMRLRARIHGFDPSNPVQEKALQLFLDWDGMAHKNSSGTTIYEATMACLAETVLVETFGKEMAAEVLGVTSLNPLSNIASHSARYHATIVSAAEKDDPRWLPPGRRDIKPVDHWNALLREGFCEAVARLRLRLGDDPTQWTWGRLHKLELPHTLSKSKVGRLFPSLGPVPIGGDSETPNQTAVILEKGLPGGVSVGASWRYLCKLSDLSASRSSHCGGQSGHPGSSHYGDGFKLWLKGQYTQPLTAPARSTLRLLPE